MYIHFGGEARTTIVEVNGSEWKNVRTSTENNCWITWNYMLVLTYKLHIAIAHTTAHDNDKRQWITLLARLCLNFCIFHFFRLSFRFFQIQFQGNRCSLYCCCCCCCFDYTLGHTLFQYRRVTVTLSLSTKTTILPNECTVNNCTAIWIKWSRWENWILGSIFKSSFFDRKLGKLMMFEARAQCAHKSMQTRWLRLHLSGTSKQTWNDFDKTCDFIFKICHFSLISFLLLKIDS